ncbi:MAG TPA: zinc ribbon domain-containing protein, partial [Castellaniella sp.]|nr:zinc ribbon domain-containing protein [Castellaniella sp.]
MGSDLTVMGSVGRDYLACSKARKQGLCDNRRSIRRNQVESLILDALRTRLMAPELVAEFCAEFTAERNRLAGERAALRGGLDRELSVVTRKLDNLITAIANGLHGSQLQAEMDCAFRRIQPSIPIESSHLFRSNPAGDSDDPSRLAVRVASGLIWPIGGR